MTTTCAGTSVSNLLAPTLAAAVVLAACSSSPQPRTAALEPTRDSVAIVVFNQTAQELRISGRYAQDAPFLLGEVAAESRKGFIFPGREAAFELGVRRVGSSSREPRWVGSVDVTPGDSIEYTLTVGGADRAQVEIRKAGRRTRRP